MGLWCGHAVLPFPSFDFFFFHLVGWLALALVTFFEFLVCHCYFSFLSAIGILFVVFSTGGCLNGSFLCSSSSQLSFFSCECLLWAWWCSPVGALACSHSPFAALLLLFKHLCRLLLVSFFAFSLHATSHF